MQSFVDIFVGGLLSFILSDKSPKVDRCYYLKHPDYIYKELPMDSIPECGNENSRVVIISDTHDSHSMIGTLPECETLIHCGDVMMTNKYFSPSISKKKLENFNTWLGTCLANERIVIGGNHDHYMEIAGHETIQGILTNAKYLVNQPCSIGGLSAWATPLSLGRSPNRAFQSSIWQENTLSSAPSEVDILITHGFCPDLISKVTHKIHIWGHSHNSYGIRYPGDQLRVGRVTYTLNQLSICVPMMNGRFRMRNLPVVIDIPKDSKRLTEIPNADQIRPHRYSYQTQLSNKRKHFQSKEEIYALQGITESGTTVTEQQSQTQSQTQGPRSVESRKEKQLHPSYFQRFFKKSQSIVVPSG